MFSNPVLGVAGRRCFYGCDPELLRVGRYPAGTLHDRLGHLRCGDSDHHGAEHRYLRDGDPFRDRSQQRREARRGRRPCRLTSSAPVAFLCVCSIPATRVVQFGFTARPGRSGEHCDHPQHLQYRFDLILLLPFCKQLEKLANFLGQGRKPEKKAQDETLQSFGRADFMETPSDRRRAVPAKVADEDGAALAQDCVVPGDGSCSAAYSEEAVAHVSLTGVEDRPLLRTHWAPIL